MCVPDPPSRCCCAAVHTVVSCLERAAPPCRGEKGPWVRAAAGKQDADCVGAFLPLCLPGLHGQYISVRDQQGASSSSCSVTICTDSKHERMLIFFFVSLGRGTASGQGTCSGLGDAPTRCAAIDLGQNLWSICVFSLSLSSCPNSHLPDTAGAGGEHPLAGVRRLLHQHHRRLPAPLTASLALTAPPERPVGCKKETAECQTVVATFPQVCVGWWYSDRVSVQAQAHV